MVGIYEYLYRIVKNTAQERKKKNKREGDSEENRSLMTYISELPIDKNKIAKINKKEKKTEKKIAK